MRHHVGEVQAELRVRLEGCELLHACGGGEKPKQAVSEAVMFVAVIRRRRC